VDAAVIGWLSLIALVAWIAAIVILLSVIR